ncbi:GNAT family N-acetyltransferase [Niabella beijingensis]|uniref:GNAT family N-acetyltransferase n=1 Tax=Niabella beijingensis TaxID=2872700 RepID=UPI001CC0A6B4|nr:GNAT family N-acetyltransferase [Niabella beijingensis]MBZ4190273.1 GNAT family N-acetyltransferase [Niabella beijingensis]
MKSISIIHALFKDLPAVLELQKCCYQSEAAIYNDYTIPPLTQTLEELYAEVKQDVVCMIAREEQVMVGAVRGYVKDGTGYINKLIVAPGHRNQGIGKLLMHSIEKELQPVRRYELFTGHNSQKNLYLYRKLGYSETREAKVNKGLRLIYLEKIISGFGQE